MITTDKNLTENMDVISLIENNINIFTNIDESAVPFILFPRQKNIIEGYEKHRFNLVKKSRQVGVSTTTLAYLSIKASFIQDEPEIITLISNNLSQSMHNLRIMRDLIKQLPREIWGDEYVKNLCKNIFLTDSKTELKLPNGSHIKALSSGKDAFCSWQPTYILMDEAAFMNHGVDIFAAGISSLGIGGKMIIVSTPNGIDPLFYKLWENAKTGKNTFNVIELNWYEDPRYNKYLKWLKDDKELLEVNFTFESYANRVGDGWKPTSPWYEEMCLGMNNDAKMIAQELDCEFFVYNPKIVC